MKKKAFYKLLHDLKDGEVLVSTDYYYVIEPIAQKQVLELIGGGYGEYLNEPHTLRAYAIMETLRKRSNPYFYIDTHIRKELRKLNWTVKKKEHVSLY